MVRHEQAEEPTHLFAFTRGIKPGEMVGHAGPSMQNIVGGSMFCNALSKLANLPGRQVREGLEPHWPNSDLVSRRGVTWST